MVTVRTVLYILITVFLTPEIFSATKSKFNLDSFLREFVDAHEHNEFREYYQSLILSEREKPGRRKNLRRLEEDGRAGLQLQAPTYYAQLIKSKDMQVQRKTFVRFGAYQDFQKQHIKQRTRFFAKARCYLIDAKTKVATWVGSWRKPKTNA